MSHSPTPTMAYLDLLFTPAFAPIGIIAFLVLFRSFRQFLYDLRVNRCGGVYAPRMPNNIFSSTWLAG